ncbi:MAG TPA: PD-(D/E)XK nuclease family protein [bacterium]|mgnify:CR=1 FL=1|nr:hypothetical protein [Myxococcales bacterium]HPW45050.1 PD-(D/E)XK nuclease family protein [bacterium]HQC50275.1 PD-(D/E)XK nuclease family protein [bacterium]HQG12922.1 PD-(D/E)XK nuclease family protein [bacterium]HQH80103.1 PD-(D/E)XK nuclease family protein [bacterium]
MPVTLIKGPINSGKTSFILGKAATRDAVIVVPSEGSASMLRRAAIFGRLTGSSKRKAIFGSEILSWQRFLQEIASPQKYTMTRTQPALLFHSILPEVGLEYFKSKRPSLGTARQFADTVIRLKSNGIDAVKLRNILDTRGGVKENDLLRSFEAYEERKKSLEILDEGDTFLAALERIRRADAPIGHKNLVAFDEFFRFLPGQSSIISAMKESYPSIEILVSAPSCSKQEKIYDDVIKRELSEIEKIADDEVELFPKNFDEPRIRIMAARSTKQECRSLARIMMENPHEDTKRSDTVLCTRRSDSFTDDLMQEASEIIDDRNVPVNGNALSVPAIHSLLSPENIASWQESDAPENYAARCRDFISSMMFVENWREALSDPLSQKRYIGRSLSAIAALGRELDDLCATCRLFSIGEMCKDEFIQLLMSGLASSHHRVAAMRIFPFLNVEFESGLPIPASRVFIPSMLGGNIPKSKPDKIFFSEGDFLAKNPDRSLEKIFPGEETLLAEESYLFDTFRMKCTSDLFLTYSVINDSGAETSKSPFLDGMPEEEVLPPCGISRCCPENKRSPSQISELVKIEKSRSQGSDEHPNRRGRISDDNALRLVRDRFTRKAYSATSLERFAQCPFVFFAEKVLNLKPLEDEIPELQPKDRGKIIHEVLEIFYREHLEDFRNFSRSKITSAQLSDLIDEIIEQVFNKYSDVLSRVADGLRPMQRQLIKIMAMQVICLEAAEASSLEEPLSPLAFEWEFGKVKENELPIQIKNDKPAYLHGFVDRIDSDIATTKFLIIDYKTRSQAKAVISEILKGRKLQLPVYSYAVKKLLFPAAAPLGGLFVDVLSAKKCHGFVRKDANKINYDVGRAHSAVDEKKWNQCIDSALSACCDYIARIRNGEFDVSPADGKCEKYCDYRGVCRYVGKETD